MTRDPLPLLEVVASTIAAPRHRCALSLALRSQARIMIDAGKRWALATWYRMVLMVTSPCPCSADPVTSDQISRVVAGITRLCEPFQQALAGMPLEKLAPANQEEARQRLLEVVDQELGRIGRFREMLQTIADADLAEAPVRLALETGTEGDRGRRYILSYERLVNRRIDTFLKVRKASGSGELDFVELAESIGAEELAELAKAAGDLADGLPVSRRPAVGRWSGSDFGELGSTELAEVSRAGEPRPTRRDPRRAARD